jgi:signal transduction histidine kinase
MKGKTGARLAWSLLGLSVVMCAAAISLAAVQDGDLFFTIMVTLVLAVPFPLIGAMIASRFPSNAIGWIFTAVGLLQALNVFGTEYARYTLVTTPGSLPFSRVAAAAAFVAWMPSLALLTTFLLLLFPGGRLPSRRWWWAAVVSATGTVLVVIGAVGGIMLVPSDMLLFLEGDLPFPAWTKALMAAGGLTVLVGAVASVTALVVRFRRSRGEERQQLKWVAFAGLITLVGLAVQFVPVTFPSWSEPLFGLVFLCLPVAAAIAILKHRLYDVDVVINKTLLYGALAAFVTAVYVGIVVGVGALVGSRENLFLSVVATALIALAFQPVRRRLSHLANRLVYGKRATPYELLSEFADRLGGSYSSEEVLPRMAALVGEGTGAARATVWLRLGDRLRPEAAWPGRGDADVLPLVGEDLPAFPRAEHAFPVRDRGELLGALTVVLRPGEALTPTQDKVLRDLAGQAGLILRNVRLIEELRASRQRLVAAQDSERRRLERNIHDGAQQQLVALAVKLRLVETIARKDGEKAAELAAQAKTESQEALDNLRDLARGIYPPLLADKGLAAALEAQARRSPVAVEIDADGIGRFPQEAEAAAYFCVLEALQNVAKYAEASRAVVRLRREDGHLSFSVEDDGTGFDMESTGSGSGLQNMADRVEALGGRLTIESAAGRGTTVTGRIPTAVEVG